MSKGIASVIGLGLIGGSIAQCLRASDAYTEVVGYDADPGTLTKALELGVIDRAASSETEAIARASLVVLATPPRVTEAQLPALLQDLPADVVLTDVASVKHSIVTVAGSAANFVAGHPIAGSERSGVEAARADLFDNHRVIVTPSTTTSSAALAAVIAMWESAGAEVIAMDAATHDAILAATSHLPHMLAYALVDALSKSALSEDIFRFAAGGFRDFTRIASSDPVMWRDVALANREELLGAIDTFSSHLAALRSAIDASDAEALEQCFDDARQVRESFVARQSARAAR